MTVKRDSPTNDYTVDLSLVSHRRVQNRLDLLHYCWHLLMEEFCQFYHYLWYSRNVPETNRAVSNGYVLLNVDAGHLVCDAMLRVLCVLWDPKIKKKKNFSVKSFYPSRVFKKKCEFIFPVYLPTLVLEHIKPWGIKTKRKLFAHRININISIRINFFYFYYFSFVFCFCYGCMAGVFIFFLPPHILAQHCQNKHTL